MLPTVRARSLRAQKGYVLSSLALNSLHLLASGMRRHLGHRGPVPRFLAPPSVRTLMCCTSSSMSTGVRVVSRFPLTHDRCACAEPDNVLLVRAWCGWFDRSRFVAAWISPWHTCVAPAPPVCIAAGSHGFSQEVAYVSNLLLVMLFICFALTHTMYRRI